MKLGVVHEMTLCKGHCNRAFWEHDNKAGSPSGNMRCVPITAGKSDCMGQNLLIILNPSLATIFSSSPILLYYLGFHFYPHAWRSFPLSTHHYIPFIQTGNSCSKRRVKANEACGPLGKKHYVVWSVQLLELTFMISTYVYKFLWFVRAAPQCLCMCVNCWYEVACVVLLCGGVGWR